MMWYLKFLDRDDDFPYYQRESRSWVGILDRATHYTNVIDAEKDIDRLINRYPEFSRADFAILPFAEQDSPEEAWDRAMGIL